MWQVEAARERHQKELVEVRAEARRAATAHAEERQSLLARLEAATEEKTQMQVCHAGVT